MISLDIFWYYVIHLSIYMAVLANQLLLEKRNDFLEMVKNMDLLIIIYLKLNVSANAL